MTNATTQYFHDPRADRFDDPFGDAPDGSFADPFDDPRAGRPPGPRPSSPHDAAAQRRLCIVVHDVAPPTWPQCERLLGQIEALGDFPVTLLAVPRYHHVPPDPAFERWLCERAARGDEIALHGYTHVDDGVPRDTLDRLRRQVYTRGEGEFWALPFEVAAFRLRSGVRWLESLGIAPRGFVPPAWLMGEQAWRALRLEDFDYVCTLRHIHLLREGTRIACQAQTWSSETPWRRALSTAWNAALAQAQRPQPLARLELHPGDAMHASLRASWQRLARMQLRTRQPCTLAQAAALSGLSLALP